MLERRLQILLDVKRYHKVAGLATRRRTSMAAVIREAIDRLLAEDEARRSGIDLVLAADPMLVAIDPAELRRELDAAHDRA